MIAEKKDSFRNGKKKVALVFGGISPEHEISVISARNIAQALDKKKFELLLLGISTDGTWYQVRSDQIPHSLKTLSDKNAPANFSQILWSQQKGQPWVFRLDDQQLLAVDVVFPILHGVGGEDGALQGFLRTLKIPFTGCDVLASALCMDKEMSKVILQNAKIPVAPYLVLKKSNPPSFNEIAEKLGVPFFIKPSRQGSSVGVHKVKNAEAFKTQLEDAFQYDHRVLAEKAILGRELEISVLGSNATPKASRPGEIRVQAEFYSYEAKYVDENGAQLFAPAEVSEAIEKQMQDLSTRAFTAMGCDGFARVDFFWSEKEGLVLNELNTLPGFTSISMFPRMWEASGLAYTQLISEIIELGLQRFENDAKLRTQFPGAVK